MSRLDRSLAGRPTFFLETKMFFLAMLFLAISSQMCYFLDMVFRFSQFTGSLSALAALAACCCR
jgi:hypothetical protein